MTAYFARFTASSCEVSNPIVSLCTTAAVSSLHHRRQSTTLTVPAGREKTGTEEGTLIRDRHKIPITILICDDDAAERTLTQQALDCAHISNGLRFVHNGPQLLDYLYQRGEFSGETGAAPRPGLILLD